MSSKMRLKYLPTSFLFSIFGLTITPSLAWSADNYWQVTLSKKNADAKRSNEFWRTHKTDKNIEVYAACDPKAKPFAIATATPDGGFDLSGDYGDLKAKVNRKDQLVLTMKGEEFGRGQRIAPVTCVGNIPTKITTIAPKGEQSFAAITGDATHIQDAMGVTLPTIRDPASPEPPKVEDTSTFLENGDNYACHATPFREAAVQTLEGVATFGSTSNLWPGALLQGKYYAKGELAPVGIPRSSGATITLRGLNLEKGAKYYTKLTGETSRATIEEAMRELLSQKVLATEGLISFSSKIVFSAEHLAYILGVDGRFLNGLDKKLQLEESPGKSHVLANFEQSFYQVSYQDPQDPYSEFRDGEKFSDKGNQISKDNPPLYVKDVSYGRRIFILVSSSFEADAVLQAINAAREGRDEGKAVSKGKSYTFNEILDKSTVSYYVLGGDGFAVLGKMGKISGITNLYDKIRSVITDKNLGQVTDLTKGVPIAHTVGYLTSLATASMGFSSSFNKTACVTTPKKYASFWMWIWGVDDKVNISLTGPDGRVYPLVYYLAGGPRQIPIDPVIPQDQRDKDFILTLHLMNDGGPSGVTFQLFRNRFGEITDTTALDGITGLMIPAAQNPFIIRGGSWNIGLIYGFSARINPGTGQVSVINP